MSIVKLPADRTVNTYCKIAATQKTKGCNATGPALLWSSYTTQPPHTHSCIHHDCYLVLATDSAVILQT